MGQTPGGSGGNIGMNLLKGGLTGLSQGLSNYGSARPQQFDFSKLQQGFQSQRPALGQGVTPNAQKRLDPFDPGSYGGGQFPWQG